MWERQSPPDITLVGGDGIAIMSRAKRLRYTGFEEVHCALITVIADGLRQRLDTPGELTPELTYLLTRIQANETNVAMANPLRPR
jgi:hypothetical protein